MHFKMIRKFCRTLIYCSNWCHYYCPVYSRDIWNTRDFYRKLLLEINIFSAPFTINTIYYTISHCAVSKTFNGSFLSLFFCWRTFSCVSSEEILPLDNVEQHHIRVMTLIFDIFRWQKIAHCVTDHKPGFVEISLLKLVLGTNIFVWINNFCWMDL